MGFDVARVRGLFPALGDGWVHLDGPEEMQVPEQVATAVAGAMRSSMSGSGGFSPATQRAEAVVWQARSAVADLVGVAPEGVVLGPNPAALLPRLAGALGEDWKLGDEVVVSRLDHQANIAPWRRVAQRCGATVRWAEIDIETCELPAWQFEQLVTSRTRLVAITAASSAVGTCPDLRTVAKAAQAQQTLLVVDAQAVAPFQPLDIEQLGADVLVLSAQAWGGPPVGILAFRDATLLERLPSWALTPHAKGPARLEVGPHAYPLLAGVAASVDYLAALDEQAKGSRVQRLRQSLTALHEHHAQLMAQLVDELRWKAHVNLIGDPRSRVPVLAFTITGRKTAEVVEQLAKRGICVSGDLGRDGVFGALGVGEVGGAVRVSLGHYTNAFEIDRLASAISDLR